MIRAKELETLVSLYGGPLPVVIDSISSGDWEEFFKCGELIEIHKTVREDDIIDPKDPDSKNLFGIVFLRVNSDEMETFYIDENDNQVPLTIIDHGYVQEYFGTGYSESYVSFIEKKLFNLEKKVGLR